jgi:hypothetical protein
MVEGMSEGICMLGDGWGCTLAHETAGVEINGTIHTHVSDSVLMKTCVLE